MHGCASLVSQKSSIPTVIDHLAHGQSEHNKSTKIGSVFHQCSLVAARWRFVNGHQCNLRRPKTQVFLWQPDRQTLMALVDRLWSRYRMKQIAWESLNNTMSLCPTSALPNHLIHAKTAWSKSWALYNVFQISIYSTHSPNLVRSLGTGWVALSVFC